MKEKRRTIDGVQPCDRSRPAGARPPAVLFVCTGNICRSPTAHALLLQRARAAGFTVQVDSAAISNEEAGRSPDPRALAELGRRGVAMPPHRARQVRAQDFERFDLIVGMTRQHCAALRRLAPQHAAKIHLLMAFADAGAGADAGRDEGGAGDVPDPWYGSQADFASAFDLIERGVEGLTQRLRL